MGILLSGSDIDRAIKRISHEIIEHNQGISNLVLMGIPTRGAYLANRIATFISEIEAEVACGVLDITLHRDDLRLRPPKHSQHVPTLSKHSQHVSTLDRKSVV